MTKGELSSLAARKRLKEYKGNIPTGKYHPATGKPIMTRKAFWGADLEEAKEKHRDYLRRLLVAHQPETSERREGTIGWYLVHRYAPLKADAKYNTKRSIDLATKHLFIHAGDTMAKDFKATELALVLKRVDKSASLKNKVRNLALEINDLAAEEDPEVRLISRKRVKPAKQTVAKLVVQTPRECMAIALSVPDVYRPAALLLACFGVRGGEAVGPFWENRTPLGTLVVINQEDDEGGTKEELKNDDSVRELPIPGALDTMLSELREAQKKAGYGRGADPMSVTRNGTAVLENNLRRAVKAARKRLGMQAYKGRPTHIFRHSMASWLDKEGCPEGIRLAIMGQSREDIKDRYVHASPADMLPWLEKWLAAMHGAEPKTRVQHGNTKTPASGERNGRAKLNPLKHQAILAMLEAKVSVAEISRREGVDRKTVRNVRDGLSWTARTSTEGVVVATTSGGD